MDKIVVLTADLAEKIGFACLDKAKENSWNVSVAVCDSGGFLLWMKRPHTVPPISASIAINKARTSALGRRASSIYEDQINNGRNALLSAPEVQGMMTGGLPLFYENQCIGAVGVSNLKPAEDELIAQAGIDFFSKI
ncbi:MAG: hypothetical protein CBC01_06600 [Betaproteobacteria bacterium TMED41]|mgnify:CR=1 FL=1|nr:MAG: hypothetical protein CBC01_06600 [Betaproteobacteria bacterium TMED41]|tara:strand:+ start:227 stop:637 length:411 start_codon:yes stop_codon:yes gene_type:complete